MGVFFTSTKQAPVRALSQVAEPGFKTLPKTRNVRTGLISNRRIFQRAGSTTEKTIFLDLTGEVGPFAETSRVGYSQKGETVL